jgi:hypothetical protein
MKKLFTLIFIGKCSFAQVTTLPNSIGIGQNTLSSIPLHINKNGEVARFQGTSPYVTFYNGSNFYGYLQAIGDHFEIGSKSLYNIDFFTGNQPRLRIYGDGSGITAYSKINAGGGINLTGALRLSNNPGTIGNVLMSVGNGTPIWGTVNENPQIGCKATFSSIVLPNNTSVPITAFSEVFDDGNNFNPTTGVFTVPSAGKYSIEGRITVSKRFESDANIAYGNAILGILVNATLVKEDILPYKTGYIGGVYPHVFFNQVLSLNQGDTVSFSVNQSNELSIETYIKPEMLTTRLSNISIIKLY